jgi:hypothetical protein
LGDEVARGREGHAGKPGSTAHIKILGRFIIVGEQIERSMERWLVTTSSVAIGRFCGGKPIMLIESRGGFDYTGKDCTGWMKEVVFREARVEHLLGPESMVIGIK